jgi:quercetin dioxygenase-like cupin family protein
VSIRIRKLSEEPGDEVPEEGFSGVNSVWTVLKRTDLTGFSSRIFRMEPGGHTAAHSHAREHVAVVIKGKCRVEGGGETMDVGEGSILAVPAEASHRFLNPGRDRLVLLIMNFFTDDATDETASPGEEPEQEKGE